MIKVENIETWGFEHAVRGMRNPMNSWHKSDSGEGVSCINCPYFCGLDEDGTAICENAGSNFCPFIIGDNDLALMQNLYKAGTEHRKYLRQIFVSMDIVAPTYFVAEMDTYKIGTTRNSCSFQHKGVSKPFSIRDFSVVDERIYETLEPTQKEKLTHGLVYPYETKEYKIFEIGDRKYKVFKNGKIYRCAFTVIDGIGNRTKHFSEKEIVPSQYKSSGYWYFNLGGRRYGQKMLAHRIVAETWLEKQGDDLEVNHIDGNKGNNCVENLEWVTHSDNEKHAYETGLKDTSLYRKYISFKTAKKLSFSDEINIEKDFKAGLQQSVIAKKYNISQCQVSALLLNRHSDLHELFNVCEIWEMLINELNLLREKYLETKDYAYFIAIRQLLPSGYNIRYTYTMNYENVVNMINQRENHKLTEWREFTDILKKLPYVKKIIGEGEEQ